MAAEEAILHEDDVRAVIQEEIDDAIAGDISDDFVVKVGGTVASPGAIGSSFSQAEVAALKTAIDAIRTKLTASGLTD